MLLGWRSPKLIAPLRSELKSIQPVSWLDMGPHHDVPKGQVWQVNVGEQQLPQSELATLGAGFRQKQSPNEQGDGQRRNYDEAHE